MTEPIPRWSTAVLLASAALTGRSVAQARPPEVRQIVTFLWQPGQGGAADRTYSEELRPIYEGIPELLRFRGYHEVESPEPLDLVVVSSYQGMAGMDGANQALRRPGPSGRTALSYYGALAAMTQHHHDQFAEMIAALSDSATAGERLVVFEYLRLVPGSGPDFERAVARRIRPVEKAESLVAWSETGRMLVSDGWDYVRIVGIRSLGDWQRYRHRMTGVPGFDALVAARKAILVRVAPEMSVR